MSVEDIRSELRAAEADLNDVRAELEAAVADAGGHLEHDRAVGFAARLEAANSRVWACKARLRTPF